MDWPLAGLLVSRRIRQVGPAGKMVLQIQCFADGDQGQGVVAAIGFSLTPQSVLMRM